MRGTLAEAKRTRGFGDFWGHMLVARGSAEAMIEPELSLWDYAALVPIVEEAGGRVTALDGGPLRHDGSVLSTNGVMHDELVRRSPASRLGPRNAFDLLRVPRCPLEPARGTSGRVLDQVVREQGRGRPRTSDLTGLRSGHGATRS